MQKSAKIILCGIAAGGILAAAGRAKADIVYYQNFSATAGMTPLSSVNWNACYGNSTTDATEAQPGSTGVPANAMISGGPSGPSASPNVNATYATSSNTDGFVPLLSANGTEQLVLYTSEYTVDPSQGAPTFSWYQASAYSGDSQRLVIKVGGQWYASTSVVTPPAGATTGMQFSQDAALSSTTYTTNASAWQTLNFSTSEPLTLGPTLSAPLPAGDITAFGVYATIADNGGTSVTNEKTYVDSYEVSTPEPASAVVFACVAAAWMCNGRRRNRTS